MNMIKQITEFIIKRCSNPWDARQCSKLPNWLIPPNKPFQKCNISWKFTRIIYASQTSKEQNSLLSVEATFRVGGWVDGVSCAFFSLSLFFRLFGAAALNEKFLRCGSLFIKMNGKCCSFYFQAQISATLHAVNDLNEKTCSFAPLIQPLYEELPHGKLNNIAKSRFIYDF